MNSKTIGAVGRAMAACALLFTAVVGAASPAGAAAPAKGGADDGTTEAAVRAYLTAYPQMSQQAARAAFDGQRLRKSLYDVAVKDSATFGGAWFDAPMGVLHLSVTTDAAQSAMRAKATELGVKVQTHVVEHSYASLDKLAASLRAGEGALGKAAGGNVGVDVKGNNVVVALSAATRAGIAANEVPAGVTLINDPNIKTQQDVGCTARNACDWTIRAGAVLQYNGSGTCSVGFTARTGSQRYVYTAGHCNSGGGTWGVTNDPTYGWIGPMTSSVLSGAYDAGIIRVDNSWFQFDAGGEIYIENAGRSIALNYVAPTMSYLFVGETVCLSANFTEPNGPNYCGIIGSTSDAAVLGMVRVDGFDACGGDSGGGWYWLGSATYRVAYGLHSRSDFGCHGDQGGTRSWFSPIPIITPVWGLAIETR
jgi:streptogrisin C